MRTEEIEVALEQVAGVEDVTLVPEWRYRVFFVFPASDAPYVRFGTEPAGGDPPERLRGAIRHREGSGRIRLEVDAVNRPPVEADRAWAHQLFFEIERELRQAAASPPR